MNQGQDCRSLAWVIEQRIKLDNRDVFWVIQSLAGELLRLKERQQSLALDFAEILVCGDGRIQFCKIKLGQAVAWNPQTEISNLKVLGAIIYHLVETGKSTIGLPEIAEWNSIFGDLAQHWLALHSDLIRIESHPDGLKLEALEKRLHALRPRPNLSKLVDQHRLILSSVLVVVLLFTGAVLVIRRVDGVRTPWLQRLARLCGNKKIPPEGWSLWTNNAAWFREYLFESPAWTNRTYFLAKLWPIISAAETNEAKREFSQNWIDPVWANSKTKTFNWLLSASTNTDRALKEWGDQFVSGAKQFESFGFSQPATQLQDLGQVLLTNRQSELRQVVGAALTNWNDYTLSYRAWTNICDETVRLTEYGLFGFSNYLHSIVTNDLSRMPTQLDGIERDRSGWVLQFALAHWRCLDEERRRQNMLPPEWNNWADVELWMKRPELTNTDCGTLIKGLEEIKRNNKFFSETVQREWERRSAQVPEREWVPIANFLHELDEARERAFMPAFHPLDPNDPVGGQIAAFAYQERERALSNVLVRLEPNWRDGVPFLDFKRVKDEDVGHIKEGPWADYRRFYEAVKGFDYDVRQITNWLDIASNEIALTKFENWTNTQGYLYEIASSPFFQTYLAPLANLQEITRSPFDVRDNRLNQLLSSSSEMPLAFPWAIWRRFGTVQEGGWPSDLGQITNAALAQAAIRRRVEMIHPRQIELEASLITNGACLLGRAFEVLTNDTDLTRAENVMNASGILPNLVSNLPHLLRYDLNLLHLRQAAKSLVNETNAAQELRNSFISMMTRLDLPAETAQEIAHLARVDFSRSEAVVHSGILQNRNKWTRQTVGDERILYRLGRSELEFVLVDPTTAAADPFYLCTIETPVGVVANWQWSAGRLTDWMPWLRNCLTSSYVSTELPLPGPRTWEPNDPTQPIKAAVQWLDGPFWHSGTAREFRDVSPPNPTHPMNYLPPKAAKRIAEEMGFRLPTRAEWLAACERNAPKGIPNLRDKTWMRQYNYVAEFVTKLGANAPPDPPYPNIDAFLNELSRTNQTDPKWWPTNDGRLWFDEVTNGAGEPFINLVGNVSEYLYEPEENTFYVAGASALSAPYLGLTNCWKVDDSDFQVQRRGFSDVGFRLAHEAKIPPVTLFVRRVQKMRYVRPNVRPLPTN